MPIIKKAHISIIIACSLMIAAAPASGQDKGDSSYSPARFVDNVTFSYMAWDPQNNTHRKKAHWKLREVAEWQQFAKTLKNLPAGDSEQNRPEWSRPRPPQTDYIRIRVITTNGFVARDIYISKDNIRITSRKQKVVIYRPERAYLQRLRKKQKKHKAFPDKLKHTSIAGQDDGIIVRYKRFAHLPNPVWRMDNAKAQNRLFDMLASMKTIPEYDLEYARHDVQQVKTAKITFKNISTPGNFQNILLTPDLVRGEKIKTQIYDLKDRANYFAFFKKRAQQYMNAR
jgi:hypothetical protein